MNSLLIALNIVKRVAKSPKTVIAMIVLPILFMFTMVVAMGDTHTGNKAYVADFDGGTAAASVNRFIESRDYEIISADSRDFTGLVKNRKAGFAVVIPKGFSTAISNGDTVKLDFYYNGNDADSGRIMKELDLYLLQFGKGVDQTLEDSSASSLDKAPAGNGDMASNTGVNPSTGFAVVFIMLFIFTTIGIILEDKKNLTLARMLVYPVREREIVLGNLLGSLVLGVLQLIPLTAALMISLGTVSLYKAACLFIILFCFLIAVTGMGIGISGLIKKAFNPVTLIAAIITPTSILGGCFIPSSMLPDFINRIGYLVPQKWVTDAINKVLEGASLKTVALNLAVIMLFGLAFSSFGLKTLRPLAE